MGLCHAIERGVAGYIKGASWDRSWVMDDPFEFSMQSWPSGIVSFVVVKCNNVTTIGGSEDTRMVEADVEVRVHGKVEPVEFESNIITDGSGTCDQIEYIVPFIRDAEHARKIVKFNVQQMASILGGDMTALIASIEPYFPTYTGTEANICTGSCPVFTINEIRVEGGDVSTSGAMTTDTMELIMTGFFEEYAL